MNFNAEQHDANMAALPETSYVFAEPHNQIAVIKRGESGFYPIDDYDGPIDTAEKIEAARQFVDDTNARMEVTPAQAKAMKFGSMFGWDKPGAHPDSPINQTRVPA